MAKYVCTICGYIYDESKASAKFSDLPASWTCPLCGAPKSAFKELNDTPAPSKVVLSDVKVAPKKEKSDVALTNAELNALCTNLAKGCEKQYRAEEAGLFMEIAEYYKKHSEQVKDGSFDDISARLNADIATNFPIAFDSAKAEGDRGALRALTWSDKVSKIVDAIIGRYKAEGVTFLMNTKIFVCEICGFIYIGDEAPDICPICKVPKLKIHEVGRV